MLPSWGQERRPKAARPAPLTTEGDSLPSRREGRGEGRRQGPKGRAAPQARRREGSLPAGPRPGTGLGGAWPGQSVASTRSCGVDARPGLWPGHAQGWEASRPGMQRGIPRSAWCPLSRSLAERTFVATINSATFVTPAKRRKHTKPGGLPPFGLFSCGGMDHGAKGAGSSTGVCCRRQSER